jgi:ethanolamine-phosphate cytidylyltransferase
MRRIWIDGCFDLFHYGHANALRRAKLMGDYLVAGVHSKRSIECNKGITVMEDDERYEVVKSCRWVDEIVEDAPFVTQLSTIRENGCSLVVHGNDPIVDGLGNDCYHQVKKRGMFQEFERTPDISTTELVGRMLLRQKASATGVELHGPTEPSVGRGGDFHDKLIEKFALPLRRRRGKILYADMYHAGYTSLFREAKRMCDYLIVGIHGDSDVQEFKNEGSPIMNIKERQLCIMSCKYVDEIIVGAPINLTKEVVERYGISGVVYGGKKKNIPESYDDVLNYGNSVSSLRIDLMIRCN